MKQIGLCLLFAVACATQISPNFRRKIARCCRIHRASTKSIPRTTCHPPLSLFVRRTAGSQNQARTGMRVMSSRIQIFQANVSFGQQQEASITSSITSAVWRAVGGPLKDYAAFVDALRSGKLDDRL